MTSEKDPVKAAQEATRMKKEGKTLKEITAALADNGFKSNRGTPYSPASVNQLLHRKAKAKAMPAAKAAATRGGSPSRSSFNDILNSKDLSAETKIDILKKFIA